MESLRCHTRRQSSMPGQPMYPERPRRQPPDEHDGDSSGAEWNAERPNLRLIKSPRGEAPRRGSGGGDDDKQFENKWAIVYVPALFLLLVWLVFVAIAHQL